MGYKPDLSIMDEFMSPQEQQGLDKYMPSGTYEPTKPKEVAKAAVANFVDPDDVQDINTGGPKDFVDPDDILLNQDQREALRQEGPVMEAQPDDLLSELKYWGEDFADAWESGNSFELIRNMWSGMLTPDRMAKPVFDADGNTVSVSPETDLEVAQRYADRQARRDNLLNMDSSAVMTARVLQGLASPSSLVPLGSSWAAVKAGAPMGKELLKVGATSSVVAAADSAAYQSAQKGIIDPEDVGIAASLGFVLGPAVFFAGNKAVEAFKGTMAKSNNVEQAVEAAKQELLALPPPQKKLPAPPDSVGPRFIGKDGREFATPEPVATKIVDQEAPASKTRQIEEMYAARDMEKAIKEDQMIEAWESQEAANMVRKLENNVRHVKAEKTVSGEHKTIMETAFENAVENEDIIAKKFQSGEVDPQFLQTLGIHAGSGLAGATIGGIVDGEEGAMIGLGLGLGLPTASKVLVSGVRRLSSWSEEDALTAFASGNLWSSPSAVIKNMGSAGRWLSNSMERAQQNIDLNVAKQLHWLKGTLSHLDDAQKLDVTRLLQHTLSPKNATTEVLAAAKAVRRELNKVLDEAVKSGVYTAKKAAQLKQKTIKEGYFPRMYDEALLATDKGKEMWVNAWTTHGFTKEGMEKALMSILHEKKLVDEFLEFARVNNSRYMLSASQAAKLLQRYRGASKVVRSKHLEAARKLHPETEKLLEPFLIKDPVQVLTKYFSDAHRRIQFAKIFDSKLPDGTGYVDGKAVEAFKRIRNEMPDEASVRLAQQTYYTMVGDTLQSDTLRKIVEMSERRRAMQQGVLTYETVTKLGLAQIPNAMQSTINGITKLLNKTGGNPLTTMSLFTKGLVRSLGKDGKEFADLSGAALETTLMEMAGEASNITKIGEKFLKYTGFISMEKMNRTFAANQGKAYAEWLVNKHAKALAGNAHPNKIKKIERAMEEIGLPTEGKLGNEDYYRAGLIFSNDVNFRHTPDKLPLAWQSPFGKLVTQFKKFAFHQGRFVKQNVMKPALRGNLVPLFWYSAPAAGIGMGIDEFRRFLKNDDRELTATERYIRGITMVGGLGLLQDVIGSAFKGEKMVIGSLAGPALSDAAKLTVGSARSIKEGDLTPLVSAWGSSFASGGPLQKELRELGQEVKSRSSRGSRSTGRSSGTRGGR